MIGIVFDACTCMKRILLISGIVLIAVISVLFFLRQRKLKDFDQLIKDKLQSLVRNMSDSLYKLEFDSLDADVLKSQLTIWNIRLLPDTVNVEKLERNGKLPSDIFKLSLDKFVINGLNINDFISAKNIDLNVIYFREPRLEIYRRKKTDTAYDEKLVTVYRNISRQMNSISLKNLILQNVNVLHYNVKDDSIYKTTEFNRVNVQLNDILIDSVTQNDTTRFLYAKDINIALINQEFRTADSLYKIKLDSVLVNAVKKTAAVKGVYIQPRYSKEAFTKKLSHLKERYEGRCASMVFSNIDWWNIITSESFTADNLSINNSSLQIFLDRRLPPFPRSKVGNYPHQLLMKLNVPVYIRTISVSNFDLTYEEFNPNSDKPGKITFNNIDGIISNVTNEAKRIKADNAMNIKSSGMLMNEVPIKAVFTFNLNKAKEGAFSVDVHLGKADARVLNTATKPLGLFTIEEGNIKSIDAQINGTNYKGTGTITFLYDDLKINALKKDENTLKKRGLLSFIANSFVLIDSNPEKHKKQRTEAAVYDRNIHMSFFNVIWKTILTGIMKTVGYDMGIKKLK